MHKPNTNNHAEKGSKDKSFKPPSFFNRFLKNPFETLDRVDLSIHVFQFNIFAHDEQVRKRLLQLVVFSIFMWALMGFDSSPLQLQDAFIALVLGGNMVEAYASAYGKFVHWSPIVIYGLMFVGLSKYYAEKMDTRGSENMVVTCGLLLFTISVFEWMWIICYYVFQHQPWILSLGWPQARIIIQNIAYFAVGLVTFTAILPKNRFNLSKYSILYSILALVSIYFWIMYGTYLPVKPLSVEVIGAGTWTNSIYFPQTVYTVETNVLDNIVAGDQFFIEDNLVHAVNVGAKVFITVAMYNLFKFKKKKE